MKARERCGVLMERSVGSLHEAFKTDDFFLADMSLNTKRNSSMIFDWQITYHSSHSKPVDNETRRVFSDLSKYTCQRLISDLRRIPSLFHHFHHLAQCVRYVHEKGVLHGDIKPNNIFIRVTDCSSTSVARVQLVLADFDLACNYKRDISHHRGSFEQSATLGTSGYHPANYCPSIPYSAVAYAQLRPELRPSERPVKVSSQYIRYHPYAVPYLDVFALGMVFLCMIHRCSMSAPWYYFIKHEITTCTTYPPQKHPPYNQNHHYCTPAHVLLHHHVIVNPTLQLNSRAKFDLYTALSNDPERRDGLRKYYDVIKLRESKVIDDAMYTLLEDMTSPVTSKRVKLPTIHGCIQRIRLCIESISMSAES
jgi:serine/threonine protein kinase